MNYLVSLSAREWRKQLHFPYMTISQAKVKLFDLELERDRLKSLADSLVDEWKLNFPRASVPIYLTRVSDKSLTTLRWRRSKTHSDKASQVSLDSEMMEHFHVSEHRVLVFKFESLRLDLNHQLSIVLYQVQRLDTYITETMNLSTMRKPAVS